MMENTDKTQYMVFIWKKQQKWLFLLQKKWRLKYKKWRVVVVKWCKVEYYGDTS